MVIIKWLRKLMYFIREGSMRHLYLTRIAFNEDGTFGVLVDEDVPFCLTLERPWLNNKKNVSCIPDGFYMCRRTNSPKFGNTFEVMDVRNRTHILFHKGNLDDDSHGCILLGEEYGFLSNQPAILSSGRAFREFLGRLEGENEFLLTIQRS